MPLTKLKNGVQPYQWSPEGSRIVLVSSSGPVDNVAPANRKSDVRHYSHIDYKFNDTGWFDDKRRHLWVVNVPGGDAKQITDGQDWNDTDPQAGIARSGAYNRTLTPYGFQNEERTYWQAPEVYYKMSPFSFADKLKAPILLIHGEADNNNGTFPIQSERFYSALKGQGATVRFVLLPLESHGYQGRESVLHMFWDMNNWLNTYVKNAPATAASSSAGSTAPSRP